MRSLTHCTVGPSHATHPRISKDKAIHERLGTDTDRTVYSSQRVMPSAKACTLPALIQEDALAKLDATLTITSCPTCGSDPIEKMRRNWTGQSQGQPCTVSELGIYLCPNWGERPCDRQAMRRIEACSPTFRRKPAESNRQGNTSRWFSERGSCRVDQHPMLNVRFTKLVVRKRRRHRWKRSLSSLSWRSPRSSH